MDAPREVLPVVDGLALVPDAIAAALERVSVLLPPGVNPEPAILDLEEPGRGVRTEGFF